MSDEDPNMARVVFGTLELQKNKSNDTTQIGDQDLNYSHKQILNYIGYDGWTDRRLVLKETGFREKQLKKHLQWLVENEFIEVRKKPDERRMKQYRRMK